MYNKDPSCWNDAARQIISFAARVQAADGLWYHGWFEGQKKAAPYKWGRANGWAMLTQVEVLSHLPDDHPDRPKLLAILRKHIEGLKRAQAPSGMWRQVLDKPDAWEETSCTGMFVYGIARACNRGWIDKSNLAVARKGFEAIAAQVDADGSVHNICPGTGISTSIRYYLGRPRATNDHHGIGPVILAGSELLAAAKG